MLWLQVYVATADLESTLARLSDQGSKRPLVCLSLLQALSGFCVIWHVGMMAQAKCSFAALVWVF